MVKITIDHPLARYHRFETELVDTFGLQSAVVVPVQANDELTMEFVTRMAAQRLSEWRPRPRVVAVSWGRTTAHVAQHLGSGWNPHLASPDRRGISRFRGDAALGRARFASPGGCPKRGSRGVFARNGERRLDFGDGWSCDNQRY